MDTRKALSKIKALIKKAASDRERGLLMEEKAKKYAKRSLKASASITTLISAIEGQKDSAYYKDDIRKLTALRLKYFV